MVLPASSALPAAPESTWPRANRRARRAGWGRETASNHPTGTRPPRAGLRSVHAFVTRPPDLSRNRNDDARLREPSSHESFPDSEAGPGPDIVVRHQVGPL